MAGSRTGDAVRYERYLLGVRFRYWHLSNGHEINFAENLIAEKLQNGTPLVGHNESSHRKRGAGWADSGLLIKKGKSYCDNEYIALFLVYDLIHALH